MTMTNEPTPIAEILDGGRTDRGIDTVTRPSAEAPAQQQPTSDPAADGSAGRDPEKGWSYAAYKQERAKRQAMAARVRELEEENRALLTPREEQQQDQRGDFWANPEAAITTIQRQANYRASRAEALALHGREGMAALNQAVAQAMQSNHPDLPMVVQAAHQSDDPVGVVMQWAEQSGVLPQAQAGQQRQRVMPSNFAGMRSVAGRSGPAYSGADTIGSIFNTNRTNRNVR